MAWDEQRRNTWDVENRLVASPNGAYVYDPYGRRVQDGSDIVFYGIDGKKLAKFVSNWDGTNLTWTLQSSNLYFAGKLVRSNGVTVATDRRGSVRANANGERMSYYRHRFTGVLAVKGSLRCVKSRRVHGPSRPLSNKMHWEEGKGALVGAVPRLFALRGQQLIVPPARPGPTLMKERTPGLGSFRQIYARS